MFTFVVSCVRCIYVFQCNFDIIVCIIISEMFVHEQLEASKIETTMVKEGRRRINSKIKTMFGFPTRNEIKFTFGPLAQSSSANSIH